LNLDFLGTHAEDLLDLDAHFSEEEVWDVVRRRARMVLQRSSFRAVGGQGRAGKFWGPLQIFEIGPIS
jgi:hypothetical protein